jgi:hypothetical protein
MRMMKACIEEFDLMGRMEFPELNQRREGGVSRQDAGTSHCNEKQCNTETRKDSQSL